MNDNFINQFGKPRPPSCEFAVSLYKRINEPMHTPARTLLFRTLTITLAVMAVLAAVLFVSPPARAFADGVIHRFGFFIFVQGEIQPEPTKQAPHDEENVDQAAAQARKKPSPPANQMPLRPARWLVSPSWPPPIYPKDLRSSMVGWWKKRVNSSSPSPFLINTARMRS